MSANRQNTAPNGSSGLSQKTIHLMIALLLLFVFGQVCPTWGPVTRQGVQCIGILIGSLWLMVNRFSLVFSSMLGLFALAVNGISTGKDLLISTLGSDVVFQLIMVYIFVGAISETGADSVLARWMISRKSLNGHPVRFTVVFCIAIVILSALVSGVGAFLFAVSMINSLAGELGYDDDSQWKRVMVTYTVITSAVGSAILPFKGVVLMIYNLFTAGMMEAGLEVNHVMYMFSALVAGLLLAVCLGLAARPLFRVDFTKMKQADVASICAQGGTRMNRIQVTILLAFCVGFLYSIVLLWLPTDFPNYAIISGIGQGFWFMIVLVVMSLVKYEGKPLVNLDKAFSQWVNWGIVFAVCAFTAIGTLVSGDTVGVKQWLSEILAPIFSGMPFPVFLVVLALATVILTNFFSNTATAVIMGTLAGPFIMDYAVTSGIEPNAVVPAIVMCASCAFLTMAAGGNAPVYLGMDCMKSKPRWVWTYGLIAGGIAVVSLSVAVILCAYIL